MHKCCDQYLGIGTATMKDTAAEEGRQRRDNMKIITFGYKILL